MLLPRHWNNGRATACQKIRAWLKDKYGLSWQIVPNALVRLLGDQDAAKSGRVMQAMLQMKKLDIAALIRAYEHG